MMLTLTWKELREHRTTWATMIVMTALLAFVMAEIIAAEGGAAQAVVVLMVLAMAATYGVVCGAMMLAGEHEGGTLVFLDVFLGRRWLLWLGKFLVGVLLVLSEAMAVALALHFLNQSPPHWTPALIGGIGGNDDIRPIAELLRGVDLWFLLLPVVTLEAYAWGLLGSALTRRVLTGAALAAVAAAPLWLVTIMCLPAPAFLVLRLLVGVVLLLISVSAFVTQAREATGPMPNADELPDPRRRFIELMEEFDREEHEAPASPWLEEVPVIEPVAASTHIAEMGQPPGHDELLIRERALDDEANSPFQVLWWLTWQQALPVIVLLGIGSAIVGLLMPAASPVLWPLATLAIGVVCGVATFAPEQRDLSCQFLAAQHFPLQTFWRFKITFWVVAASTAALLMSCVSVALLLGSSLAANKGQAAAEPHFGPLRDLMGSTLFFGIWLAYGFSAGQLIVWLCRKSVLALLLASLVALGGIGVWLPSLLCRGMNGWQLWVPPFVILMATSYLVRAWASGRLRERKPTLALCGFTAIIVAWLGVNLAYRAWEIRDVGEPLDREAFKKSAGGGEEHAGMMIRKQLEAMKQQGLRGVNPAVAKFPIGPIVPPRGDGQPLPLEHLLGCAEIARFLLDNGQPARVPTESIEYVLVLSRCMRSKASIDAYVAGTAIEERALEAIDRAPLLPKNRDAKFLRKMLERLYADTPPATDCLQTECYRAGGFVLIPTEWALALPGPNGEVPVRERWLNRGIVLSTELPWESERKMRLWQAVWAGLFRAVETPHWQIPKLADLGDATPSTRQILRNWIPPADESVTAAQLARLLDASWLSNERLFCPIENLRAAANQSRWQVEAHRQALALELYQFEEQKTAERLEDLVPKYLPELSVDPYSGKAFGYRVSTGEVIEGLAKVTPGQGILWSTGPDRIDNGGRRHGQPNDAVPGTDLITVVPPRR